MMTTDAITLGVFGGSLAVLLYIGIRKLATLRMIDVQAAQENKTSIVKGDLIANRLYRKFCAMAQRIGIHARPVLHGTRDRYHRLVDRIEAMEREYRLRAMKQKHSSDPEARTRAQALCEEANQFVKDEEYDKAEQKFIEAISLQPHSVDAFCGLGGVYLQKKDYDHARESLRYAVKLGPTSSTVFLELAELARASGDLHQAYEQCRRAVALEPNDPKSLDALLETSIALGEKAVAQSTLKQLEVANPENQKLNDFRERIAVLP